MCVVGSVTTTGAIDTLATGVGVVVALPLGVVSLATGAMGLVGSTVQKILLRKLEKHDRLLTLAEAKLMTINGLTIM
jgi:fructose-1-phosphate kinase PfkB-like protein